MRTNRVRLVSTIALSVSIAVPVAMAADVPQYVKGPVSGFQYDCQQAKQAAPTVATYITTADLDGDGKPDHIIDAAKGCQANRDLYCNAEGCSIDVFLSSTSGTAGSLKVRSFKIVKHNGKPALEITRGGASCGASDCTEILLVIDGALKKAP